MYYSINHWSTWIKFVKDNYLENTEDQSFVVLLAYLIKIAIDLRRENEDLQVAMLLR